MLKLLLSAFLGVTLIAFIGCVHAEPFIEVAGGTTQFHQYRKDGARWYQDAFPWTADLRGPAWRIGVGEKINDKWDYTVSWLSLGRNSVAAWYVRDEDYDPVNHRCLRGCDKPTRGWAFGSGHGPEFSWRRHFDPVYVRTGLFLWISELHMVGWHQGDPHQQFTWQQDRSFMLAPFLGAGYRHTLKKAELFAEVTHYHGLGSGGYPIARRATVPMLGGRWEF